MVNYKVILLYCFVYLISFVGCRGIGSGNKLSDMNGVSPACSPDGKYIAFQSIVDSLNNYELFVMDIEGKSVRRLTYNPKYDGDPAWSPDGKMIAFESTRSGNADIWLLKSIDDTTVIQITTHPADDGSPTFSPDGKKIAFTSERNGGLDIWMITIGDTSATQVTTDTLFWEDNPCWSPDGRYIAFDSNCNPSAPLKDKNVKNIFVKDLQSGEIFQLKTNIHGNKIEPKWSFDGTKLAFVNVVRGEENVKGENIIISNFIPANTEGKIFPTITKLKKVVNLSGNEIWGITWTKEGNKIIFGKYKYKNPKETNVWIVKF